MLRTALDRVRRMPGVVAAGANSQVPFGDFHESSRVARIGQKADRRPRADLHAS